MNTSFFKPNYSDELTNPDRHLVQKDGYIYAKSHIQRGKLLLVISDDKPTECYVYQSPFKMKCIDFLDKGIMTVYDYNCNDSISFVSNMTDILDNYNRDRFNTIIRALSEDEIVENLLRVFYYLHPTLQFSTLAGGGKAHTNSDPNYYSGQYFLQDGEMYTILKHGDRIEFYKGPRSYTELFKPLYERNDCIYREFVNYVQHDKAIELYSIRCQLQDDLHELLQYQHDKLIGLIERYEYLNIELSEHKFFL